MGNRVAYEETRTNILIGSQQSSCTTSVADFSSDFLRYPAQVGIDVLLLPPFWLYSKL